MQEQSFQIVMRTPIGERYGILTAKWERGQITGFMEILEHRELFCGQVDEKGNCRLEGRIVSLARMIPYVAVGQISRESLRLSLRGERNVFEVDGIPCAGNGGIKQ